MRQSGINASKIKGNIVVIAAIVIAGLCGTASRAGDNKFESVVQPFIKKHCVRCHGATKHEGDLRLDTLTADFDSAGQAAVWIEVMDNLNLGEMPPEGEAKPSAAEHRDVVRWLAAALRAARTRSAGAGGRVLLRRLNRTEFSNTIRDLFQMRFLPGEDPAELLPPDPTIDGFDKVGSALMLDPSLLAGYYEAARRIVDKAIVSGPPAYPTRRTRFEWEDMAKPEFGFAYVCGSGGRYCLENDVRLLAGAARVGRGLYYPGTKQMFPVNGFYTVRIRAAAQHGRPDDPVKMFVRRINGRESDLIETEVTATLDKPRVYSATRPMVAVPGASGVYMQAGIVNGSKVSVGMPRYWDFHKKMEAASKAGNHAEALRLRARMKSEGWTGGNRPAEVLLDPSTAPKLIIDWIEIEGPLYEAWPPLSHKALFFKDEDAPKDMKYVREMFARFLPRAFRRPVEEAEVERVVELVRRELKQDVSFEDAIKVGLTYTLTSPAFLYLVEPRGKATLVPTKAGLEPAPRALTDFELASRLSYFLWSSMPDPRLLQLAGDGRLGVPAILVKEVDRMVADPKSRALVDSFAAQWLRTGEFLDFTPDRKIYRDFDPALREDMVGETLAFFEEVLREDLSVLSFLDSEFVMVNEPLAKFYGLEGVKGKAIRRVSLPKDSPRGGLLGQAGVHLRGSDGIRTKPVNRGVYVREVLFNDPPDPPPPNVGEVEPNIQGKRLTVRERLLQHQQIEACASCHRGIDGYGLALENFDATGAWRDRQNGEDFRGSKTPPIDASGKLPNGRAFKNFLEFKALLLEQDGRFRRALAEKLFVYALGRPVEPADRGTIDAVVAEMVEEGDTLRAAIKALVATSVFRTK